MNPGLTAEDEARSPPGRWRLLAAALPCWALTAWAITTPGAAAIIAGCAALLGAALIACWVCTRGTVRSGCEKLASSYLLFVAALVLIGAQVSMGEHARSEPRFVAAAEHGTSVQFEARLAGYPEADARDQFVASEATTSHVDTAAAAVTPSPASSPIRGWVHVDAYSVRGSVPMLLWIDDVRTLPRNWAPGTGVAVRARINQEPPAATAAYTADIEQIEELATQAPGSRVGAIAAHLRHQLAAHAAQVPGAELVPGFAVGDTSLVSDSLEELMLESSLSHLTAVSGSNIGLVVAAVTWCAARLGAGRRARIMVAAVGLAGFVVVVGPDASVQRAAIMAIVLLVGSFGGRQAAALPALGLAILVLLALNPWQALHPGFALSIAATAGILLTASPITGWLRRRARIPTWLALPIAVAISAQLACGPLLLLLQSGVPVVGVLANVIAAPAAPIGTGLGLIAALLGPVSSTGANIVLHVAAYAARWVAATAEVCAGLPGGRWSWPEGWAGAGLLAACQLALLCAWAIRSGRIGIPFVGRVEKRAPWQPEPEAPQGIRITSAVLASAAAATIVAVTLATPLSIRLTFPRDWVVVACDVAQGDAILVRDAEDPSSTMLIDTGDDPAAINSCLANFGVERISLLVLTHDDRDHVGALDALIDRVDAALIAPSVVGEQTATREVVKSLTRAGIPFTVGAAGTTSAASSRGVSWQVLAPAQGAQPRHTNASSLVLLVRTGAFRVLLLGDTGYTEQAALLTSAEVHADVVKVAHHGSRDQDPSLPHAVRARWALVSVGAENGYGHPAADTLSALTLAGTKVLRTDQVGSVALTEGPGGELTPWVERARPNSERRRSPSTRRLGL